MRVAPRTRQELLASTGLTRPTVDTIVHDLLAEGLVVESKRPSGAKGGRPTALLQARPDARILATVRFAAIGIETVLSDLSGTVLDRHISTRPPADVDPIATTWSFAEAVRAAVANQKDTGPLGAVSLCLPGNVDRVTGRWRPPGPDNSSTIPLVASLTQTLQVPVTIANVAAASLAGSLASEANPPRAAALVYLGRGVGSAATSSGKLIDGFSGSAGELGHSLWPGNDRPCTCGRRGCLQTITSAAFIRQEYRRLTHSDTPVTLREMEDAGIPQIDAMLTQVASTLATAASWLVNVVNPEVLFLGGSPFMAGATRFATQFGERVVECAHAPNAQGLRILTAPPNAVTLGGVSLAADLLPSPFSRLMPISTAFAGNPSGIDNHL